MCRKKKNYSILHLIRHPYLSNELTWATPSDCDLMTMIQRKDHCNEIQKEKRCGGIFVWTQKCVNYINWIPINNKELTKYAFIFDDIGKYKEYKKTK